jgi:hypothetical protein
MAFEDAATLAITLGHIYRPNPMPDVHTRTPVPTGMELLNRWCFHRQERVQAVHDFTSRNGELMSNSDHFVKQAVREWAMWAALKMQGPEAGTAWLYGYHCEAVLGALGG